MTEVGCYPAATPGEAVVTVTEAKRLFADDGYPAIEHFAAPDHPNLVHALQRTRDDRSDLLNAAAGCPALAIHI